MNSPVKKYATKVATEVDVWWMHRPPRRLSRHPPAPPSPDPDPCERIVENLNVTTAVAAMVGVLTPLIELPCQRLRRTIAWKTPGTIEVALLQPFFFAE